QRYRNRLADAHGPAHEESGNLPEEQSNQPGSQQPYAPHNLLYDLPRASSIGAESFKFVVHLGERLCGKLQVFARMRGGDLRTHASGAVRHNWVKKADDVNAFLKHSRSEFLRFCCIPNHDRDDWMHSRLDRQTALRQRCAEKLRVFFQLIAQFGRCAEKLKRFQGSSNNWWRDSVGK